MNNTLFDILTAVLLVVSAVAMDIPWHIMLLICTITGIPLYIIYKIGMP